jgi:hypothetical protein
MPDWKRGSAGVNRPSADPASQSASRPAPRAAMWRAPSGPASLPPYRAGAMSAVSRGVRGTPFLSRAAAGGAGGAVGSKQVGFFQLSVPDLHRDVALFVHFAIRALRLDYVA